MADLGSVCFFIDGLAAEVVRLTGEAERIADALERLAPAPEKEATP